MLTSSDTDCSYVSGDFTRHQIYTALGIAEPAQRNLDATAYYVLFAKKALLSN